MSAEPSWACASRITTSKLKLIVSPYYEVLARMIVYHGWPGVAHRDLTHTIDCLLPGLFPMTGG